MKQNEDRKPNRPFAYAAKGDVTNMVYDDSGLGLAPPPESPKPASEDGDKGPISETVSTTVPG